MNCSKDCVIKIRFKKFLLARNPSLSFAEKYIGYMRSSLIVNATKSVAHKTNIFEVSDRNDLYKIYSIVKIDSRNIRLHNVYSGVVSAYIKFLSGHKLRKMVNPPKTEE